jgi:ACS family hexuronate transporter-like MFS transporter
VGEGGNFPASIKTIAEWFPKRERALATAIFNSGSNFGPMLAAIFVPWCMVYFGDQRGWRMAFILTGAIGFIWLIFWFWLYDTPERQRRLSQKESDYIHVDDDDASRAAELTKVSWVRLLGYRQTWAFFAGKFMTDGIWWFYLFWVPGFLKDTFHVKITELTLPMIVIYSCTTVGSIGGGWLSSSLIRRGWTVNAARKTTMLIFAICVVPAFAVALVPNMWAAILLIALAASAHQGFSANIFTLVSDTVPKQGVSAVTGIGAMAGGIGSMIFQTAVGIIVDKTGTFVIPFIIASSAYVIAVLLIHLILPRLERMELGDIPTTTGPTPLDP